MLLCWVYEYLALASTLFFNYDIIIINFFFLQRIGMRAQEQLGESPQPPAKKLERIRYNIFEYDIFETSML